jgi:hypothetical protein
MDAESPREVIDEREATKRPSKCPSHDSRDCLCGLGAFRVGAGWPRESLPVGVMVVPLQKRNAPRGVQESHATLKQATQRSIQLLNEAAGWELFVGVEACDAMPGKVLL